MVKTTFVVVLAVVISARAISPGLPADPTDSWCSAGNYYGAVIPDWYHCYPNPLGSRSWDHWFRIPDSAQVGGCLLFEAQRFPKSGAIFNSHDWYLNYFNMPGPLVPRLVLDLNGDCFNWYAGSTVVFNLHPGDSIQLEYKLTPRDTSVADTIWGEMKAYYRGTPYTSEALRFARGERSSASWSQGEILLSRPETGPIELLDLRGHILSTRGQIDGLGTRVIPSAPLSPGLYHLRWPGGHAGVVVPR